LILWASIWFLMRSGGKKKYMKKEKEYPERFMLLTVNKYSPCQFLKCFDDNITFRLTWFLYLII
jgi:hypothetical protein